MTDRATDGRIDDGGAGDARWREWLGGDGPLRPELRTELAAFVGPVLQRLDETLDAAGERPTAGELTRWVRSRWLTEVFDPRHRQRVRVGRVAIPVRLPESPETLLWLLIARRPTRRFWLLTTEDASTEAGAVAIPRAYARRWPVEWTIHFAKADLGIAGSRLHRGEARRKLGALVALVHAVLRHLRRLPQDVRLAILRWCHRTGQRAREAPAPLYRLRQAIANLWGATLPALAWNSS